jgi:cytochrome-b5 reductase
MLIFYFIGIITSITILYLYKTKKPQYADELNENFQPFKIERIESITKGENPVNKYTFKLKPNVSANLSPGGHVSIKRKINNEEIKRSYSPVTTNEDKGYFSIIIKCYNSGKLTKPLCSEVKVGDVLLIAKHKNNRYDYQTFQYKKIIMVSAG